MTGQILILRRLGELLYMWIRRLGDVMYKRNKIVGSFILLLLLTACSITVGNHKQRYSVYGSWKLVQVSGGPDGNASNVNKSQHLQFNTDNTFAWYHGSTLWAHGKADFFMENNVPVVQFTPVENVTIVNKRYSLTEQSQLRLTDECSGCYLYIFGPK